MPTHRLDPDEPLLRYKRINEDTKEVHRMCTRQTQRKNDPRQTPSREHLCRQSEKVDKTKTVAVVFVTSVLFLFLQLACEEQDFSLSLWTLRKARGQQDPGSAMDTTGMQRPGLRQTNTGERISGGSAETFTCRLCLPRCLYQGFPACQMQFKHRKGRRSDFARASKLPC